MKPSARSIIVSNGRAALGPKGNWAFSVPAGFAACNRLFAYPELWLWN